MVEHEDYNLKRVGLLLYGFIAGFLLFIVVWGFVFHRDYYPKGFWVNIGQSIIVGAITTLNLSSVYFSGKKHESIEINNENHLITIDVHYYRQSKDTGAKIFDFNDIARIKFYDGKNRKKKWLSIEFKPYRETPDLVIGDSYCKRVIKRVPDLGGYWKSLFANIPIEMVSTSAGTHDI